MAKRVRRRAARGRLPAVFETWLGNHGRALSETLDRLISAPLATAMTVAAIAVALGLPATLFVALDNLQRIGGGWERGAGLSLFLAPEVEASRAGAIAATLTGRADIDAVELISPEQGLAEFREYSGLGAALDQLSRNPLPAVLAIRPAAQAQTTAALQALARSLEALPEVDFARLDAQWTQRFNAIVALLTNTARLLAGVLGLAVPLVVGNTIRLEIENRRSEVEIMAMVGATPAFIRRPFLYSGAAYGLLGGIAAWIIVSISIDLLQGPVSRLATLYQTRFALEGLAFQPTLALLGAGVTLGMLGSWLAVGRHLIRTEPD